MYRFNAPSPWPSPAKWRGSTSRHRVGAFPTRLPLQHDDLTIWVGDSGSTGPVQRPLTPALSLRGHGEADHLACPEREQRKLPVVRSRAIGFVYDGPGLWAEDVPATCPT